jgi:predicted Ser/Thr protein kinase
MNITEPFVLKRDIRLIPCAELSDDVRARITFDEGDYTLSHRHGRTFAQVIDGDTAALLSLFREPRTIVDAVFENSRSLDRDPEVRLDEMLPHIGLFVRNRVLVPAGSEDEQEIRPRFEAGAVIAGWTIVRCASFVEDCEVYQLSSGNEVAALKIARMNTPSLQSTFENEIAILRHLEGSGIAPRLLDAGEHETFPYLIVEWLHGVEAGVAAAQRRHDRALLIELCASLAAAYARLHEHRVMHADIHPRNVVVGEKVMLIDFGYAHFADGPAHAGRGGLYYFFEPELLAARGQGRSVPASEPGDQYAVAALLYFLITGNHYLDFRYERDEMSRQVQTEPPLAFAERGVPPWPEVERILLRALAKDPAQRFDSMMEMAAQLADVRDATIRESLDTPLSAEANALLETTLHSYARGGAMFLSRYPNAPRATINFGCAGAAIAMLRIAETRGDAALLALADVWRSRAAALIGTDGASYDDADLSRESVGDVTPYHTESGIHMAAAMIAAAMGDAFAHRRAVTAFLHASNQPCAQLDLTLGRSGSLLAASMLLAISDGLPEGEALRAFGAETMRAIWNELDAHPPLATSPPHTYLGMAHGWAGYLYAAMRWCAASGDALPSRLRERLDEYVALKTSKDRGVYWRMSIDGSSSMPGWCHGTAGTVFLFTLAHRLFGDERFLQLAEGSAWHTWDEPRGVAHLCCGSAGRAYALLDLYQHTGDSQWLSRARQLANHAAANAASTAQRANSLWKGELGVAVLIADLAAPENASMPSFGDTRTLRATVARAAAAGASRG